MSSIESVLAAMKDIDEWSTSSDGKFTYELARYSVDKRVEWVVKTHVYGICVGVSVSADLGDAVHDARRHCHLLPLWKRASDWKNSSIGSVLDFYKIGDTWFAEMQYKPGINGQNFKESGDSLQDALKSVLDKFEAYHIEFTNHKIGDPVVTNALKEAQGKPLDERVKIYLDVKDSFNEASDRVKMLMLDNLAILQSQLVGGDDAVSLRACKRALKFIGRRMPRHSAVVARELDLLENQFLLWLQS